MALAQKQVKIVYSVVNKATGQSQKITKSIQKNFTKLTHSITTTQKAMGVVTKQTRVYQTVQKSMSQQISAGAKTLSKFGRRMMFTGFVLRSAFRSISRAVKGLGNAVKDIVTDYSDFEKMTGWLSRALTKLAVGGQLNEEWVGRTITAWDKAMEVSRDLIGEVGKIEVAFFELKTEAAASTLEFVEAVNEEFDKLDWEAVKTGIGLAADAFYDPLIKAIEDIIDEETMGMLLSNLETLGGLTGEFTSGIVDGLKNIIGWFGESDGEGAMGAAHWIGEVGVQLSALTIPAILIGTGINTLAGAFTVVSGAVVATAEAIGITGTSGLLLALGAIAIVGATIITHWEDDFKPALQAFGDAVDDVWAAFSGGDKAVVDWKWFMNVLKDATQPLADVLSGFIDDVTWLLNRIADIRLALDSLGTGLTEGFPGVDPAPGKQWGGHVAKTGLHYLHKGEYVQPVHGRGGGGGGGPVTTITNVILDGRTIARQISRAQGRDVRSTLIMP